MNQEKPINRLNAVMLTAKIAVMSAWLGYAPPAILAAPNASNAPPSGGVASSPEAANAVKDAGATTKTKANAEKLLPGPKKDLTVDLGGGITIQMVLIRPGTFTMGDQPGHEVTLTTMDGILCIVKNADHPAHKVTLTKPFYLGKYEVTQEQWEKVMGSNPATCKGAKNPVNGVNWDDCQDFIKKLNEKIPGQAFRLPTEAELEYARRAGSTGDYCYGDGDRSLGDYAWYAKNSGRKIHPVGEKKPNAWGLYDMHGNVWEWCADWYAPHTAVDQTDPVGQPGPHIQYRVLGGGSWFNLAPALRSAYRFKDFPAYRHSGFGMRAAAVATP
jgi:formylglycine-generating enzyme required for sulfatase activity